MCNLCVGDTFRLSKFLSQLPIHPLLLTLLLPLIRLEHHTHTHAFVYVWVNEFNREHVWTHMCVRMVNVSFSNDAKCDAKCVDTF